MAHRKGRTGKANEVVPALKERASEATSWIPGNQRPLDTEDIDSEWPAEPEEMMKLAVAQPEVPKGPSVPADLQHFADEVDSEWPEAPAEPAKIALPASLTVQKAPGLPKDLGIDAAPNADDEPKAAVEPVGSESKPVVAAVEPVGSESKPVAASAEAESKPVVALVEPLGLESKPVAAVESVREEAKPTEAASKPVASTVPRSGTSPAMPRVASHAQDPFAETKSKGGLLILGVCVVAAAILALVFRSQSQQAPAPMDASRKAVVAPMPKPKDAPQAPAPEAAPTPKSEVSAAPAEAASTAKSEEAATPEPAAPPNSAAVVAAEPSGNSAATGAKSVLIESFPTAARVYVIDGAKWTDQGFTPASVQVSPGTTLRVMLVKEGFRRRQLRVDGTQANIKVGLVEQPAAAKDTENAAPGN